MATGELFTCVCQSQAYVYAMYCGLLTKSHTEKYNKKFLFSNFKFPLLKKEKKNHLLTFYTFLIHNDIYFLICFCFFVEIRRFDVDFILQKMIVSSTVVQLAVSPYHNRVGETRILHLHSGRFWRSQTALIGLHCCQTASTE